MNHFDTCSNFKINPTRQRGAVLLVSLMILLILTMLTLVAMKGGKMQERIAGSTRSLDLSLQAAEAALRQAENNIGTADDLNQITGMGTVKPSNWYSYFTDETDVLAIRYPDATPAFWASYGASYPISTDEVGDARITDNPPMVFVESLPPPHPDSLDPGAPKEAVVMYRITALGRSAPFDGADPAPYSVVLQSTFHR